MLVNKKVSKPTLTNATLEHNRMKMSQITLYQPMRATKIDTIHGHAEYVPVDKTLAGFTTPEEAEKMLAIFRAKDPFGVYKVLDINYQYATNFTQYDMYRNNFQDMRECSFNRGSLDTIKDGLFIAHNEHGGYAGTYASQKVAEIACHKTGCAKGEENIDTRKVFQTYAGYQRYITALKKRGEEITTR